jgi:acetylornithine deacetylase
MQTNPGLNEMVEKLISTPSISSTLAQYDQSNLDVVHLLANWLEPLGFEISINPIPGKPEKANLIAKRGSGDNAFVLSGHTDTVPLDEALWDSNPFTITEKDDRWYGLGTCDMKSFFALIIEALTPLLEKEFTHPLIILATADEESTMSGARALSAAELCNARFAVIGEPTGLKPVNQHKGIMMLRALVTGTSGHSSNPGLGRNALEGTSLIIDELVRYKDELKSGFSNDSFAIAYPTLNLGCIHGGDNPNRICDHVDLAFDVRVLPGMDNDEVMETLRERLKPRLTNLELTCELELLHPPVPPFENQKDELMKSIEQLTGQPAMPVAFATEAPFLDSLGMETMVLGPGSIDQAHQPNEFIPLNQLTPTIDIIRNLISKYCCEE